MRQLWEMPLDGGFQGEHLPVTHWFNPAMMVSHLVADGADFAPHADFKVHIPSNYCFCWVVSNLNFIFHH